MRTSRTVMIFTTLFFMFISANAFAGVKTIKPDDFKPYKTGSICYITPEGISGPDSITAASFYTRVKLPVGKKIKRLVYYHLGNGGVTNVRLLEVKVGQQSTLLIDASSADNTGTVVTVPGFPSWNVKVKAGYTYWLFAATSSANDIIKGVSIFY